MSRSRRLTPRCIWPAALALCALCAPAIGKEYALLVGTDDFLRADLPRFQYAEADVRSLGEALAANGYDVRTLVGSRATRRDLLLELSRSISRLQPEDTLLFYSRLPGVRYLDRIYYLGYDVSLEAVAVDGIRLDDLIDMFDSIPAKRRLLLLDSVFTGTVEQAAYPVPDSGTRGEGSAAWRISPSNETRPSDIGRTQRKATDTMVLAVAALAPMEFPQYKHGAFANSLLEALSTPSADANNDGRLLVSELEQFVRANVPKLTDNKAQVTSFKLGAVDWIVGRVQTPVAARFDTYQKRLTEWQERSYISLETYVEARAALRNWRASPDGPLSVTDEVVVELMKKYMDIHDRRDEIVAQDFEANLKAERSRSR